MGEELFDSWTDRYEKWFETPTGRMVKVYEEDLLHDLVDPKPHERILDIGCGTGIFTETFLIKGAGVIGLDLSLPMLKVAVARGKGRDFSALCCDMCALPFGDESFDKVVSMTAIEFIADARCAIAEMNRVTRPGGTIVVTTLNSLSPWAEKRRLKAEKGHTLFQKIHFRAPEELAALLPTTALVKTAIHFQKDAPVEQIPEIEKKGSAEALDTGALLAVKWKKLVE